MRRSAPRMLSPLLVRFHRADKVIQGTGADEAVLNDLGMLQLATHDRVREHQIDSLERGRTLQRKGKLSEEHGSKSLSQCGRPSCSSAALKAKEIAGISLGSSASASHHSGRLSQSSRFSLRDSIHQRCQHIHNESVSWSAVWQTAQWMTTSPVILTSEALIFALQLAPIFAVVTNLETRCRRRDP
jgi:hypothetical protein